MPRHVIGRDIPGTGNVAPDALRDVSGRSGAVLDAPGPKRRWERRDVSAGKVHCVPGAGNAALLRAPAQRGGFPADQISRVAAVIDPVTAQ